MEKLFEKLGDRLTNFFTRSVAPSSIFFILLFFNDMYFNDSYIYNDFICFIKEANSINGIYLYIVFIIIFLSYGYINQILTQLLDNFIKISYTIIDEEFINLRLKVESSLSEKEKEIFEVIGFNDYNAYQILGKDIKTSLSYVDDVKSIHSFILAINLNVFIIYLFANFQAEAKWLFCSFCIGVIFVIGNMIAKMRYKARNKKLYINFLLKKDESKIKEKELKIKSLKVEINE